ncbi:MAG: hypothetical protein ACXW2T_10645, partial [Allosphingosinicella sp.]
MPKLRTKRAMVGWFDPIQLIQTGIRVMISTVFGEFADKREAFAGANPISDERLDPKFNYSGSEHRAGFGFDYVADTGDGWNPTFAVARLLAEPELQPAGAAEPLARGQVLIMGGDQVYPTATRKDYDERLLDPYEEAWSPAEGKAKWDESARPDLFAVPGNHDWYDGLKIFFHLFCRRTIKEKGRTG